jgi:peptide-methionine (S)-S-oxide reductase
VLFSRAKGQLPTPESAHPGHATRTFSVPARHAVLGTPIEGPFPEGLEVAYFGLGCFWGAEELFWEVPGVYSTAAGYQGGISPNPTYEEVCTGRTGHTEAVQVVYDPAVVSYRDLLRVFWESHDPTQYMRQGNDLGTQYRSAIYTTTPEQAQLAEETRDLFQGVVKAEGYDDIATEILPAGEFFYAEDYHQQYLHKVPNGYRCHSTTGLKLPA